MGLMLRTLVFPLLLGLTGCATGNSPYAEQPSEGAVDQKDTTIATINPDITTAFENLLAKKLFSLAVDEISSADPQIRSTIIDEQINRLARSIDVRRLSKSNKLQLRLFQHLKTHRANKDNSVIHGLKSISAESDIEMNYYTNFLPDGARKIQNIQALEEAALQRLDEAHQVIRTLNQLDQQVPLNQLFESKRTDKTEYLANTHQGRQDYLSRIVSVLLQMELLLPAYVRVNSPGDLGVEGTRDHDRIPGGSTTYYDASTRTILIDISDMSNLPVHEIESLALYLGIPGRHALVSMPTPYRVQELLHEPGYKNGWAGYSLSNLNRLPLYQHPTSLLHRAYFQSMLASLAIIDINIHTKGWTQAQAVNFSLRSTPFPTQRLRSFVGQAFLQPGLFAAPFLVTEEFNDLKQRTEQRQDGAFDLLEFNTMLLGIGEMPLAEIRRLVDNWNPG